MFESKLADKQPTQNEFITLLKEIYVTKKNKDWINDADTCLYQGTTSTKFTRIISYPISTMIQNVCNIRFTLT